MENASDALFMAFAVLVFVIALTVAINSFSQVKAVSDIVLYSADKTNYYDYQGATGKASQNREVGLETLIPTLYKYYKENYTILFREGNYDKETGEFSNVKPLTVYTTASSYKTANGKSYLWGKKDETLAAVDQSTYDTLLQNKYSSYFDGGYKERGSTKIFSFDLEEETLRHEPWTGTYAKAKENLDCLLQGKAYNNPNNNQPYIDYKKDIGIGGFAEKYKDEKFIETIGEYSYSDNQSLTDTDTSADESEAGSVVQIGSTIGKNTNAKKKRIVVFTLIN